MQHIASDGLSVTCFAFHGKITGDQTMDLLTPTSFRRLADITDVNSVSLLMPTHTTGREVNQDPIRLKNLLKRAEERLVARGQRAADVRKQLEPLSQLIDDVSFWAHQQAGMAAFVAQGTAYLYAVPFSLPEHVVVGRHCYLLPLARLLSEDTRFYVLAISPKHVRLLSCSRHAAEEVALPGWPEDFEDMMQYVEGEPQLRFRAEARPTPRTAGSEETAMFHGHPGEDAESERKQRLLEFSRLIDRRVRDAVGPGRTPLVLACDQRLAAIYREATAYPGIVEKPVAGNPDRQKPDDLRHMAWEILAPVITRAREASIARCYQAAGNGRAADNLEDVILAAHDGRVDTLLICDNRQYWGKFDPQQRRLDIHDSPAAEDEELLNLAMITTLKQRGTVQAVTQDRLPNRKAAVAILRY